MRFTYPAESINKEKVEEALRSGKIQKRAYIKDDIVIDSNLNSEELEKTIDSSSHYSTIKIKADIDCANCAMEV